MALSPSIRGQQTRQIVAVPEPMAHIDTRDQPSMRDQANGHANGNQAEPDETTDNLILLYQLANAGGDVSHLLEPGQVARLGTDAVQQWRLDLGSCGEWRKDAEKYLNLAAQNANSDERDPQWEGAADINYPILSTAVNQFVARAGPELIKGDKVVGVKVFSPPTMKVAEMAKDMPQPQSPQEAQAMQQQAQQMQAQAAKQSADIDAKNARAERVKHYLNFVIFYRMDCWEEESDLLLLQASAIGSGAKKIYMGERGLKSDFLSSTCLTVHNDTQSIYACPRITQDFSVYPYEIEDRKRAGIYRDIELPSVSTDPQMPRTFIEQHRLDDLDGDGLAEPYIVTVDVDTQQTMRVEPAYNTDDIIIDETSGRVLRINRWLPFAWFTFLPDPRGRFYGLGLGALLDSITDSVDTAINQLIDAGTAEIAGGGFIGSGVRLQGSGQGGTIFFRPGEYPMLSTQGIDLRQAIWERTLPHPSAVTMQMLELLLSAAKDIASIKDVITGESPATAPVGTTLALQNQALQVFSSIYKRIYRGFRDEFRLMYECLKRWGTDREKREYEEITGGNFDQDFAGDGTDIQPVADPTVVSKMQKIAKMQTIMQLAESPVGQAAGMTQPGPAQAIIQDALDVLDVDRPERFTAPVAPNPMMIAQAQERQATAQLKGAQVQKVGAEIAKTGAEIAEIDAKTTGHHADTMHKIGQTALDTHSMHQIADLVDQTGSLQPPPEGNEANGSSTPSA